MHWSRLLATTSVVPVYPHMMSMSFIFASVHNNKNTCCHMLRAYSSIVLAICSSGRMKQTFSQPKKKHNHIPHQKPLRYTVSVVGVQSHVTAQVDTVGRSTASWQTQALARPFRTWAATGTRPSHRALPLFPSGSRSAGVTRTESLMHYYWSW